LITLLAFENLMEVGKKHKKKKIKKIITSPNPPLPKTSPNVSEEKEELRKEEKKYKHPPITVVGVSKKLNEKAKNQQNLSWHWRRNLEMLVFLPLLGLDQTFP
jgi:hypothetical protein